MLYLGIGCDFDEMSSKAARARCAAATKARADNYQNLLRVQEWTEELIAEEAGRDSNRKI